MLSELIRRKELELRGGELPVIAEMKDKGGPGIGIGGSTPAVDFTANKVSGTAPLTVTFTATANYAVARYLWYFSDTGETSFEGNPIVHTFYNPGDYEVLCYGIMEDTTQYYEDKNPYITVLPYIPKPKMTKKLSSTLGQIKKGYAYDSAAFGGKTPIAQVIIAPENGTDSNILTSTEFPAEGTLVITHTIAPDVARKLVLVGETATVDNYVILKGIDINGNSQSETVHLVGTTPANTAKAYKKLHSVTIDAAKVAFDTFNIGTANDLALCRPIVAEDDIKKLDHDFSNDSYQNVDLAAYTFQSANGLDGTDLVVYFDAQVI